ncbi:hypothetical protein [Azospirillum sp. sgz301742]
MDPESEAVISDLANSLRPTTQQKIVAQVSRELGVNTYILGDVMVAKGVGMEEAREIVHSAILPMKVQADLSVKAEGVPDDGEFWEWAKEHRKPSLEAAIRSHAEDRTTQGYRTLAREYVSNLDAIRTGDVMDAARAAGIGAREINGRIVLDIPGHGSMGYASAVKHGLIRVSRNV